MSLESRLETAGQAWRAQQPAARRFAEPSPRRGRWLPGVAAAVVVVLALAAALVGSQLHDRGPTDTPATSPGGWEAMPPGPLSPRLRPIVVSWGNAVVVVGGRQEDPCPPNASCPRDPRESLRDGALYDVISKSWRTLPLAPIPLDVYSSAVVGDVLYLLMTTEGNVAPRLLALDLLGGTWENVPAPPVAARCCLKLVAAGERLIGFYVEQGRSGSADFAFVRATGSWEKLPAAPFDTSYDRSMVWTGDALVLVTPGPPPGQAMTSRPPFLKAAVLVGQSWRVLPDQQTVIGGSTDWSWSGARVVSATTLAADGGQTNGFGRTIPAGGQLDPATGAWSELPSPPATSTNGGVVAADSRYVANGEGLVFDAREQRWIQLPPPPEAADQDAGGAWAAGRLVVWGGAAGIGQNGHGASPTAHLLATGAVWTPPGAEGTQPTTRP